MVTALRFDYLDESSAIVIFNVEKQKPKHQLIIKFKLSWKSETE